VLSSSPWVLIPVKSFNVAKQRLSGVLDPAERRALAVELATGVIAAAAPWPTIVISGDDEVDALARTLGASTIPDPGSGLVAAIEAGAAQAYAAGAHRIVIVHADLPLVSSLSEHLHVAELGPNEILIVPDRHRSGTNVLSLHSSMEFPLQYGPGSFGLHLTEARRRGFVVIERVDRQLSLDIDTPADFEHWQSLRRTQ
jgi:2-phospho-L-lactate/phosphoenolpyruvate guanylyltransferase